MSNSTEIAGCFEVETETGTTFSIRFHLRKTIHLWIEGDAEFRRPLEAHVE